MKKKKNTQLWRVRWMHVWNLWGSVPPTRLRITALHHETCDRVCGHHLKKNTCSLGWQLNSDFRFRQLPTSVQLSLTSESHVASPSTAPSASSASQSCPAPKMLRVFDVMSATEPAIGRCPPASNPPDQNVVGSVVQNGRRGRGYSERIVSKIN